MIDRRRADLERHLEDLRKNDGWHPFQHFVIGLLPHAGYTDVRHSNPRSDFGCDAVAITPDGQRCVAAVSFECTKKKVLDDAKRSLEDPNREDATVLVFITNASPAQTTWTKWKPEVAKLGLELRMFNLESILDVATRDLVWRETCARLGITGHRAGYRLITPYDSGLLRQVLQLRPAEWIAKRIELREWAQLGELRNRLILGKPGAGKTTTVFVYLEANRPEKVLVIEPDLRPEKVEELLDAASGGGVIVFDDAHEKPDEVRALISALRARQRDMPEVAERYCGVRLLLSARSQEWCAIEPQFSVTELQDVGFTLESQITLGQLTYGQCRELVEACTNAWELETEDRMLEHAAIRAAEQDATPLYVLSMLSPARVAGRLLDEHLTRLPSHVLELWNLYWRRLTAVEQGILRIVKLFAITFSPTDMNLFGDAAAAFSIKSHDLSHGLATLETSLWISRQDGFPRGLDVQLESIVLSSNDLARWDHFVATVSVDVGTRVQMHNGTGLYSMQIRAPRAATSEERQLALRAAEGHFTGVSTLAGETDRSLRALALNNLSTVYSKLASSAPTREGQVSWLWKGAGVAEEAINIYRELRVHDAVAMSLNNVSGIYLDLFRRETTAEGQRNWLHKAEGAIEEAAHIYRNLGMLSLLARILNNAASLYCEIAELENMREDRRSRLQSALEAVGESIHIRRMLGTGDLAASLQNASKVYFHLATSETAPEGQRDLLMKARETVEESVRIRRDLGLQSSLAGSLVSASALYYTIALRETDDTRTDLLRRAVTAAEEAVSKYRKLGLRAELAMALDNASTCFAAFASEMPIPERGTWLQKAVGAVNKAISTHRELGIQESLAISLGSACKIMRMQAEIAVDQTMRIAYLRASYIAIHEGAALFKTRGNMHFMLLSQRDVATALVLLNNAGEPIDTETIRAACTEGRDLAVSMENRRDAAFFEDLLAQLANLS